MLMLLAQIPTPAVGEFEHWLWPTMAAVAMVVLLKKAFTKIPADHEQYANKVETNKRLADIEDQIADVVRQAAIDKTELVSRIDSVPYKTIALLKDMKGLLPSDHFLPHNNT